jgi:glutathione S-transferase
MTIRLYDLATAEDERRFIPYSGADFADPIVFGAFQSVRARSDIALVEPDDPVWEWRRRMLDAYDGLAGKALACAS